MSLVAAFLSCEAIVVAVSAVVARGFPIPTCTLHVFLRWLLLSWAGVGYFDFHFLAVCEAAHHGRRACWYKCYDKSKTPLGTDRGSVGLAKNQDSIEPSERHMRIG